MLQPCTKGVQTAIIIYRISASGYIVVVKDLSLIHICVRVDAKGEITLSAYNGKVNVSCKVEELVQYVADSSNSNQ